MNELPLDEAETAALRAQEWRLIAMLAGMCGLVMAAGLAVPRLSGATALPPAIELGNVAEAHFVEIRDHRGQTALSGEFRSSVDRLGNTEKDAALVDSAFPPRDWRSSSSRCPPRAAPIAASSSRSTFLACRLAPLSSW